MHARALPIVFFLAMHGAAVAQDGQPVRGRIGDVVMQVPSGLDGPHRTFPNKATGLDVYFSRKDLPPTLLQLSHITSPGDGFDASAKARSGAAGHFLDGFLQMFSKNVQDWKRSPTEQVRLGGHPAVRAAWSGNFHARPTTGVMYIVVLGKESYSFHAFGQADVPNPTLASSIRAIEGVRIEPPGARPRK